MQLKRKLPWILTGKSLMAVASISMVALALVTYTAQVTINLNGASFTLGSATDTWTINQNDAQQLRYLPDAGTAPLGSVQVSDGNTTNAFKVQDDGVSGTAVEITLQTLVSGSQFSQFEITVGIWTSGNTWSTSSSYVTIFNAATGGSSISYINGISGNSTGGGNVGYLHIPKTVSTYADNFEIIVKYTVIGSTASTTATFVYTPTRTTTY